jgi:hypothetical protein
VQVNDRVMRHWERSPYGLSNIQPPSQLAEFLLQRPRLCGSRLRKLILAYFRLGRRNLQRLKPIFKLPTPVRRGSLDGCVSRQCSIIHYLWEQRESWVITWSRRSHQSCDQALSQLGEPKEERDRIPTRQDTRVQAVSLATFTSSFLIHESIQQRFPSTLRCTPLWDQQLSKAVKLKSLMLLASSDSKTLAGRQEQF